MNLQYSLHLFLFCVNASALLQSGCSKDHSLILPTTPGSTLFTRCCNGTDDRLFVGSQFVQKRPQKVIFSNVLFSIFTIHHSLQYICNTKSAKTAINNVDALTFEACRFAKTKGSGIKCIKLHHNITLSDVHKTEWLWMLDILKLAKLKRCKYKGIKNKLTIYTSLSLACLSLLLPRNAAQSSL